MVRNIYSVFSKSPSHFGAGRRRLSNDSASKRLGFLAFKERQELQKREMMPFDLNFYLDPH